MHQIGAFQGVPPAQLALATIVQAYPGASDDEVVEAAVMDRRWQLILHCLDAGQALGSARAVFAPVGVRL